MNNDTYEQSPQEMNAARYEIERLPSEVYRQLEESFRTFLREQGIDNLGGGRKPRN